MTTKATSRGSRRATEYDREWLLAQAFKGLETGQPCDDCGEYAAQQVVEATGRGSVVALLCDFCLDELRCEAAAVKYSGEVPGAQVAVLQNGSPSARENG